MKQSKEGDAVDAYFASLPPIKSKKMQVVEDLPLGFQQLPVMIGRKKNKNVIVQTDGRFIEIKQEHIRDTAFALLAMVNGAGE